MTSARTHMHTYLDERIISVRNSRGEESRGASREKDLTGEKENKVARGTERERTYRQKFAFRNPARIGECRRMKMQPGREEKSWGRRGRRGKYSEGEMSERNDEQRGLFILRE